METPPSVFCVNICKSLEFAVPPTSVPILRSASDERTFYIILPSSDQQINTVAHLNSYIVELFQISSPTCLNSSNGNVLENASDVESLNSVLHRRILVCAGPNAGCLATSSKSTKTNATSDIRQDLLDKELCNQHGVTSYVKITLDRYEVSPYCSAVKSTVQVLDLSSVEPLRALKTTRWWPSSVLEYGTPKADKDNDDGGKDFDAVTPQVQDCGEQIEASPPCEAVTNSLTQKETNRKLRICKKFRSLVKLKKRLHDDFPDIPLRDIEKGHKTASSLYWAVRRHFCCNVSVPTKKLNKRTKVFSESYRPRRRAYLNYELPKTKSCNNSTD